MRQLGALQGVQGQPGAPRLLAEQGRGRRHLLRHVAPERLQRVGRVAGVEGVRGPQVHLHTALLRELDLQLLLLEAQGLLQDPGQAAGSGRGRRGSVSRPPWCGAAPEA